MVLSNFDYLLKKYAQLIVETGINVKKGQSVVVQVNVEQAPLARLITAEAYAKGAADVIIQWTDDFIHREFLLHAEETYLSEVPAYKVQQSDEWMQRGASRISIVSASPDSLAGVAADRISLFQSATGKAMIKLKKALQSNQMSWTVVAAAGKDWAAKVFPDLSSSDEQIDALWHEIFKTTRIYTNDPIRAWKEHDRNLESKADELNKEQFDALHYIAPGTDLTIGLPKNHLWEGAGSKNTRGETFMANMPTEEVFTAPDFRRVNGVVSSTKPLSYAGTIISGMRFTFENGKVIAFSAEEGEEILKTLLDTDEGARYLGEVALVPDPSPISQSGITFYNTLFDENASNHLAFGSAYAFTLQGGTSMDEEQLKAAGLNQSQTHVDFMIGSDKMAIDGIKKDGSRKPIFRDGDWV